MGDARFGRMLPWLVLCAGLTLGIAFVVGIVLAAASGAGGLRFVVLAAGAALLLGGPLVVEPPEGRPGGIVAAAVALVGIGVLVPDVVTGSSIGTLQWSVVIASAIVGVAVLAAPRPFEVIAGVGARWRDAVERATARPVARVDLMLARGRTLLDGRRGDLVAVGSLIVLGVAVFAVLLREPLISDDLGYFTGAERLLDGDPVARSANSHRFGLIVMVAAAQAVVGATSTAYHAVPLLLNVGLLVAVYAFGRLFFPRWVAWAAAVLLLAQPVLLEEITILLPDWPAMTWFLAGLVMSILAVRAGPTPDRRRLVLSVLGGAALFMALWTKEGVAPLFLVAPVVLWGIGRDERWRRWALIAAGTIGVLLAVEILFTWVALGDPLSRFHAIVNGHLSNASRGFAARGESWDLWRLATRYIDILLGSTAGVLLCITAVASLVAVAVTRDRRLIVVGSFAVFGAAFVSLAIASLDPLGPLLRTKARYLALGLAFLPTFALGGLWVAREAIGRERRLARLLGGTAVVGIAVVAFAAGFGEVRADPHLIRNGADALSDTRQVVVALESVPSLGVDELFTDHRTRNGIQIYLPDADIVRLDYSSGESEFTHPTTAAMGTGDLVVLNRTRLEYNEARYYDLPLPSWVASPPPNWVLVGSSRSPRVGIWYVLDEQLVAAAAVPAGSVTSIVDGERVPLQVSDVGTVTVDVRGGLEIAATGPVTAGSDVVIVGVQVTVRDGSVSVESADLVVTRSDGEEMRGRLRTLDSIEGQSFTGSVVIDEGEPAAGYTVTIGLAGSGSAEIAVSVAFLDAGFDRIDLD